jgi:hypothetical protein
MAGVRWSFFEMGDRRDRSIFSIEMTSPQLPGPAASLLIAEKKPGMRDETSDRSVNISEQCSLNLDRSPVGRCLQISINAAGNEIVAATGVR